jgi:hypothetical protein
MTDQIKDKQTVKQSGNDRNMPKRPDLDGEGYRDSTHYRPISTREYFKVLFYCTLGFFALVLLIILYAVVIV